MREVLVSVSHIFNILLESISVVYEPETLHSHQQQKIRAACVLFCSVFF